VDLREMTEQALRCCTREGAVQADIFAASGRTVSVYVEDGLIKNTEEKEDQGISVRVLKGRKMGQASASCATIGDVDKCVKAASRLADLAPVSRTFQSLPMPAPSTHSPDNWDPSVDRLEGGTLGELAGLIVDAAEMHGVKVSKGMIRGGSVETLVRNSNEVDASNRYTLVFSDFASLSEAPSPGEGVASYTSPRLEGLDPVDMGTNLAKQARAVSKASTLSSSLRLPLFILPGELGEMLDAQIGMAVSADSVQKKRSPWLGQQGQEVASPEITIIDDPSDSRAVLSAPYDDEGVPTAVKPVVKKGVLCSCLYDAYTASVEGKTPSGNGLRRGPHNSQYVFQNGVAPGHFNLVVSPGSKDRQELLSSFDRCVLIERFSHPDVNPVTGAFALEVRLGHVLNRGSIERTFKHALVVGNLIEALRNVVAVGRDAEVVGSMILPTIGMDGIEVVGSG